jgi:hypothetical protein
LVVTSVLPRSSEEHLKQQFGAGLRQRHEAEFVDDQKLVGGELPVQAQPPLLVAGPDQPTHSAASLRDFCSGAYKRFESAIGWEADGR